MPRPTHENKYETQNVSNLLPKRFYFPVCYDAGANEIIISNPNKILHNTSPIVYKQEKQHEEEALNGINLFISYISAVYHSLFIIMKSNDTN